MKAIKILSLVMALLLTLTALVSCKKQKIDLSDAVAREDFTSVFYYIDYCLAQTVSLSFFAKIQKNLSDAFRTYMAYTVQGGSRVFTELLQNAGLDTPLHEKCLREVAGAAPDFLAGFDLSGID